MVQRLHTTWKCSGAAYINTSSITSSFHDSVSHASIAEHLFMLLPRNHFDLIPALILSSACSFLIALTNEAVLAEAAAYTERPKHKVYLFTSVYIYLIQHNIFIGIVMYRGPRIY